MRYPGDAIAAPLRHIARTVTAYYPIFHEGAGELDNMVTLSLANRSIGSFFSAWLSAAVTLRASQQWRRGRAKCVMPACDGLN